MTKIFLKIECLWMGWRDSRILYQKLMIGKFHLMHIWLLLQKWGQIAWAELQYLGFMPKIMDKHDVAATMDKAYLGIGQGRILVKCLKTYFLLETIFVLETSWRTLGQDHAMINTDMYELIKKEWTNGGTSKCDGWVK